MAQTTPTRKNSILYNRFAMAGFCSPSQNWPVSTRQNSKLTMARFNSPKRNSTQHLKNSLLSSFTINHSTLFCLLLSHSSTHTLISLHPSEKVQWPLSIAYTQLQTPQPQVPILHPHPLRSSKSIPCPYVPIMATHTHLVDSYPHSVFTIIHSLSTRSVLSSAHSPSTHRLHHSPLSVCSRESCCFSWCQL